MMKAYKSKLKTFTILELVVAMVLTSIVVSIAYLGFYMVSAQINKLRTSTHASTEFISLNSVIMTDVARSKKIVLEDEGIRCDMKNGKIHYIFRDSLMIRTVNELQTDTFRFRNIKASFWFENRIQNIIDKPIDALSLQIINRQDTLPITVMKLYDAQSLLTFSTP